MRNFILIAVLVLAIAAYAGLHFMPTSSERVLRVGVECDYTPNNWEEDHPTASNIPLINKKGYFAEGYDVQIAKLVAQSLGAKLEIQKIAWEELIPALNNNKIDAIFSGMLDNSDRRKIIAFSDVYGVQFVYSVMVKDNSKYSKAKKLTDFEGAKFIGQKGTNLDSAIDQLTGAIHLEPVETVAQMFEKLLADEVDGIIVDSETVGMYQKMYPELIEIRFPEGKGFKFDYTGVCVGLRKQDTKLTEEINAVLKKLSRTDRERIMDSVVANEMNSI